MGKLVNRITGIELFDRRTIGFLFIYLVAFVPLIYKFVTPFLIILGLSTFGVYVTPIMLWVGLYLIKNKLKDVIIARDIILYLLFAIFIFVYSVLFPQNKVFFEENYVRFIVTIVPFYFIGLLVDNEKNEEILGLVAKIGVIVQVFWLYCQITGLVVVSKSADGSLGEQMKQSYDFLFTLLLQFYITMRRGGIQNFIFLLVAICICFFLATRGPILIFVLFITLYITFFHRFRRFNSLKKISALLLASVIVTFFEDTIYVIIPFVEKLGFSARVFNSILEQQMTNINESSGRDEFYQNVIEAIKNDNAFLGYGWGGDRLFTPTGAYAHNFFLEVLAQFGVIIGGILLAILLVLLLKSFRSCKTAINRQFWLVMVCAGIFELQLSKTYIDHHLFFVMIGFMICLTRKNRYVSIY